MLSKVSMLIINVIGALMTLIVAVLLFYFVIKPKNEELIKVQQETSDLVSNKHGTDTADKSHKTDVIREQAAAKILENEWARAREQYMPTITFNPNPLLAYENQIMPIPRDWGTWVTRWYGSQYPAILPTVNTGLNIAAFDPDPNKYTSLDHLTFPSDKDSWKVEVSGRSFGALMNHLRSFNTSMHRRGMPVINNVTLTRLDEGGYSHLLANYDFNMYVILESKPPTKDPLIDAATAPAGKK